MARKQTYGKRSRAVYGAIDMSSPDQPSTRPSMRALVQEKVESSPITANESRKRAGSEKCGSKLGREVLRERSHNAVVEPVELAEYAYTKSNELGTNTAAKTKGETSAKLPTKIIFGENEEDHVVVSGFGLASETIPGTVRELATTPKQRKEKCKGRRASPDFRKEGVKIQAIDIDNTPSGIRSHCPADQEVAEATHNHCKALINLSRHPLTDFNTWSSQLSEHFLVTKIAEASFGEVYRLSLREAVPEFSRTDESVFKIIPLRPVESMLPTDRRKRAAMIKKTEFMSKPQDVENEVRLLQRMSAVPGFTNFRDVRILRGRPAPAFVAAFKEWNIQQKERKKDLSHFPDPTKKSSYNEEQLWAVIEMQDAGTDLERIVEDGTCTSVWFVWDTFWQVALSLAKGEEAAEFEHRDLHLGNICVRDPPTAFPVNIDRKKKLHFTSLETTIIDYTISRCAMPDSSTAYTDLSLDSALFEGDSTEEYQYEIYRYMRSILFLDEALADFHARSSNAEVGGRSWEQYHPQTNLVWLHLVLYKLLDQVTWPSAMKIPNRKTRKHEYWRWKRANDLEHVLLKVQDLLDPEQICWNGITSAGDLILFALQEEWLDVEDVVGHGYGEESALISQLGGLEL